MDNQETEKQHTTRNKKLKWTYKPEIRSAKNKQSAGAE
jgi:hypothetical protein